MNSNLEIIISGFNRILPSNVSVVIFILLFLINKQMQELSVQNREESVF